MLFIPEPTNEPRRRIKVEMPRDAAPLTLVAVEYVDGEAVILTFNRAVDIAAINWEAFVVDDQITTDGTWGGTQPVEALSPTRISIALELQTASTGPGRTLTVTPDNGIIGVAGGTWAGVNGVAIPFG